MRCDRCGNHIPRGQEVVDTKSEQTGLANLTGAYTSTVTVMVCRPCSDKRNRLEKVLWVVLLVFLGVGLLALLPVW
jgi:hypothetical protein